MRLFICLLGVFLISLNVQAIESDEAVYRDFSEARLSSSFETCGSLCMQDANYIERLQMERDFAKRGHFQTPIVQKYGLNAHKGFITKQYMSLSFHSDSRLARSVLNRQVRWATMVRNVGVNVSENGKSFTSAIWRQMRRPLLQTFRNKVLKPYRGKKLSTEEKIEAWVIEQSVESGASALELEATGEAGFESENLDFGIYDYSLKYRPKVDPLKGRYGMRVRYKKHLSKRRPFYANLSYYYCNSSMAVQKGRCGYQHELSGRISTTTMKKRLWWSLFVSYQAESLDESVYQNDGVLYDHKPWLGGVQLTYAFFGG